MQNPPPPIGPDQAARQVSLPDAKALKLKDAVRKWQARTTREDGEIAQAPLLPPQPAVPHRPAKKGPRPKGDSTIVVIPADSSAPVPESTATGRPPTFTGPKSFEEIMKAKRGENDEESTPNQTSKQMRVNLDGGAVPTATSPPPLRPPIRPAQTPRPRPPGVRPTITSVKAATVAPKAPQRPVRGPITSFVEAGPLPQASQPQKAGKDQPQLSSSPPVPAAPAAYMPPIQTPLLTEPSQGPSITSEGAPPTLQQTATAPASLPMESSTRAATPPYSQAPTPPNIPIIEQVPLSPPPIVQNPSVASQPDRPSSEVSSSPPGQEVLKVAPDFPSSSIPESADALASKSISPPQDQPPSVAVNVSAVQAAEAPQPQSSAPRQAHQVAKVGTKVTRVPNVGGPRPPVAPKAVEKPRAGVLPSQSPSPAPVRPKVPAALAPVPVRPAVVEVEVPTPEPAAVVAPITGIALASAAAVAPSPAAPGRGPVPKANSAAPKKSVVPRKAVAVAKPQVIVKTVDLSFAEVLGLGGKSRIEALETLLSRLGDGDRDTLEKRVSAIVAPLEGQNLTCEGLGVALQDIVRMLEAELERPAI